MSHIEKIIFILAVCHGLASPAFSQQPEPPTIAGVHVGLADRYKAGLWTQVEVTIQGGGEAATGQVAVIVPDGDGVPGRVTTPADKPCRVLPGKKTTVRLITRFGRVFGSLTAEFLVDGRPVASRTFETASQADGEHFLPALEFQNLTVIVGDSTLGVEAVGKLSGAEPGFQPVAARLDDIDQLPEHWCGYECGRLFDQPPRNLSQARGRRREVPRPGRMDPHGRPLGVVCGFAGAQGVGR